jgi:dihydropteroate synthase
MGILNVTPDSFSDGGRYAAPKAALHRAWELVNDGADLLDLGGESTRPGAESVEAEVEIARTIPIIQTLVRDEFPIPISIDTSKAEVAEAALQAGACIVNDVTALRGDDRMRELVRRFDAGLVLMHMHGTPRTMQDNPSYGDVVREVGDFLDERIGHALAGGIARERIIADPGIGFGKNLNHNLALLARLDELSARLGIPILIGPSRKRFIGELLDGAEVQKRIEGTLAAVAIAAARGVEVVRVHDVRETIRFLRVWRAIEKARAANPDE